MAKNCRNSIGAGCFAKFNTNYDGSNTTFYDYDNDNSKYKFISADGIAYLIASYNSSCTSNGGFDDAPFSPMSNSLCGYVYIDVNAFKPPNYWGRDIFMFYITSKTSPLLYPSGGFYNAASGVGTLLKGGNYYWRYNAPSERCSVLNKFGHYCTGRVMEEGWKMNY